MRHLSTLAALVAAIALALTSAGLAAAPTEAMPASAPVAAPATPLVAHELTAQDAQAWLDGLMPTALRTARAPGAVVAIVKDG